jgi:hypothetical protein
MKPITPFSGKFQLVLVLKYRLHGRPVSFLDSLTHKEKPAR